jgi:hypothetical protein
VLDTITHEATLADAKSTTDAAQMKPPQNLTHAQIEPPPGF